ncbi:MAG: hypothetical protein IT378_10815 [Sandaracinaceae bacterium]|nr:hypothetical protein [Sandaracinaceae bacterium]
MTTMTAEEIERFVKEVVHYAPAVAERAPLIKRIVERLVASELEVSTRFDIPASSVERPLDGSNGGHVRLNPTVGADCLWDLAHEAGHLGEPAEKCDAVEQLRREEAAWDEGWALLMREDPTLASSRTSYEKRRDYCLRCYRKAAAQQLAGTS